VLEQLIYISLSSPLPVAVVIATLRLALLMRTLQMCCRKRLLECTYLQLEEFHSALERCYFSLALAFVTTEAEERGIIVFGILVALR